MQVWSETRKARNGREYEVRLLLTDAEAKHLQRMWALKKMDEIDALNVTIERLTKGAA